jgi:energy-coupling factor transporter ATP-binding protein EcfA2
MNLINEEDEKKVNKWIETPQQLIITGPTGCGKTNLSYQIMKKVQCNYEHYATDNKKVGKQAIENFLKETFGNKHIMSFFKSVANGVIFDEIENYNLDIETVYEKYHNERIIYIYDKLPVLGKSLSNILVINIDLNKFQVIDYFSKLYKISKTRVEPYFHTDLRKMTENIENVIETKTPQMKYKNVSGDFICKVGSLEKKFECATNYQLPVVRLLFQNYKKCVKKENYHKVSQLICDSDILEKQITCNGRWNYYDWIGIIGGTLPSMYVHKNISNLNPPQVLSKISNANGRQKVFHDLQKQIIKVDRHYDSMSRIRSIRNQVIFYIQQKNNKKAHDILNKYKISIQDLLRIYDSDITKKDKLILRKTFSQGF